MNWRDDAKVKVKHKTHDPIKRSFHIVIPIEEHENVQMEVLNTRNYTSRQRYPSLQA
ncbi:hypothetical protein HanIR_Chr03g0112731 [Helianthus annuus]|nr:hypothetical protein HanIR_Chr03g0112731 [Helianthus annuus]